MDIKDVKCFNVALIAKWKWRFATETTDLWIKILESKYENRDN